MVDQLKFSKEMLLKTLQNSYSPFSKVKVSACVESSSGKHYYGCNVENSTFGATICAERSAIVKMISEEGPEAKIKRVYVVANTEDYIKPCGICRQNIFEFATDNTEIICLTKDGNSMKTYNINDFLPEAFKL